MGKIKFKVGVNVEVTSEVKVKAVSKLRLIRLIRYSMRVEKQANIVLDQGQDKVHSWGQC